MIRVLIESRRLRESMIELDLKVKAKAFLEELLKDDALSFKTKLSWVKQMIEAGVISKEEANTLRLPRE